MSIRSRLALLVWAWMGLAATSAACAPLLEDAGARPGAEGAAAAREIADGGVPAAATQAGDSDPGGSKPASGDSDPGGSKPASGDSDPGGSKPASRDSDPGGSKPASGDSDPAPGDSDPASSASSSSEGCPSTLPDELASDPRTDGTLIVVWKSRYKLGFYDRDAIAELPGEGRAACFDIALGDRPEGPKRTQGDRKTPEGWYWVAWKIPYGSTSFYKALYVSYPNEDDAALALSEGRIDQRTHDRIVAAARSRSAVTDTSLGSLIEIHGSGSRPRNWTLGCVALDDEDMDFLYDAAIPGKTAIFLAP